MRAWRCSGWGERTKTFNGTALHFSALQLRYQVRDSFTHFELLTSFGNVLLLTLPRQLPSGYKFSFRDFYDSTLQLLLCSAPSRSSQNSSPSTFFRYKLNSTCSGKKQSSEWTRPTFLSRLSNNERQGIERRFVARMNHECHLWWFSIFDKFVQNPKNHVTSGRLLWTIKFRAHAITKASKTRSRTFTLTPQSSPCTHREMFLQKLFAALPSCGW